MFDRLIVVILAIGIFPSLTALSLTLREAFPDLTRYSGPINILKLTVPILLYYLWTKRKELPRRLMGWMAVCLAIGTVATLIAGFYDSNCRDGFPTGMAREWAVILLGCIAGLCFVALPLRHSKYVVIGWGLAVYGSAVLDYVFPSSIEWLLANLFDPETRALDFGEVGHPVLTGVFGRQSMAKMLAWMPWLILFYVAKIGRPATKNWPFFILAVLSTAGTLATSQRGPFLAALVGWAAFALHEWYQLRRKTMAVFACYAIGLSLVMTVIVVPRPVLQARMTSLLGIGEVSDAAREQADANVNFRKKMLGFSVDMIAAYPLGRPCITIDEFRAARILHFNHSHNLLIQQFRERGWIWGFVHLAIWMIALMSAWKKRSELGSSLFAGIVVTLTLGMFDHPWFVLNHSMLLWAFLWTALSLDSRPSFLKNKPAKR